MAICRKAGAGKSISRKPNPTRRALFWRRNARWPITCRRCWPSMRWGPNLRLRQQHPPDGAGSGRQQRLRFPGLRAGLYPPLFCRGIGPFRWVALSGDPQDIYKTDAKVKEIIKDDQHLHHWLDMARERISFRDCRRVSAGSVWSGGKSSVWRLTKWCAAAKSPRRSSLAGITLTPAPSPARTAKPKRCAMVLMRSPTGRCSTPCSIPPAARLGCRCTTAAG
ncbi:hypothetical protein J4733_06275 [Klebsiella pneumoniae]|uniref:Urocanase C-terminal domain-containing protein n=1 Tax=Klebsiella pneumoniae TaxID=573 RepID=A0A939NND8_KLEPN|nr:hypothetical protein [Klebsiella pneumoniae]